jgi:hypothetical protein
MTSKTSGGIFRHMVKALDRTLYKESIVNCNVSGLPYRTPLSGYMNFAHDSMVYVNDILWICGGDPQEPQHNGLVNCTKLNLLTKQFEYMASMSTIRTRFNMVHVEGKIYALMGKTVYYETATNEVFDIANETWSPLPDFPKG